MTETLRVGPLAVPADFGFAGPGEAIDAAGGVPGGASEKPLLVVVNDPDRATRTADALRALRARIGRRRIEVLVATGSHRYDVSARTAHAAPLLAAAGEPCRIAWHDGHEPKTLARLPVTGRQFSKYAQILARLADTAAVGSVEPHWFAGVTGAHKAISIGLFGVEEIARNHQNASFSDARPFRTAGNPVYEDLRPVAEEVTRSFGVFAVQHVAERWLAGDPLATLPALAGAARARWLRTVPKPLDWVVAHVEPPLSKSLYQAEKAVKHTEFAVKDGGAIVVTAECEGGIGPPRFVELMSQAPDGVMMASLVARQGYRLGDHKALRLRSLLDRGVRLFVVSKSLDPDRAATAGFRVVPSVRDAVGTLSGDGAVVDDAAHCVLEVA